MTYMTIVLYFIYCIIAYNLYFKNLVYFYPGCKDIIFTFSSKTYQENMVRKELNLFLTNENLTRVLYKIKRFYNRQPYNNIVRKLAML